MKPEPAFQDPATNFKPLSGGWVDVCWAHDESLSKTRRIRSKHTLPDCLFGTSVPPLKTYHTIRLCEAAISYKLFVKPRAAYFPKKRLDFVKQSNASWLFVPNVSTLKSSVENRLCEALILYKLFVKPRTTCFPMK
jgi:hypothetical protein